MDYEKNENASPNLTFPQDEAVGQESLLQVALHHRWAIFLAVVCFVAAAFVYILKATPIFTSKSRLYVEQIEPRIISEYDGGMSRSNSYLYTHAELLKSIPIVGEVVDNPRIAGFRTFDKVDNPAIFLQRNLDVSVGKKDEIISVGFDSPYPQEAAQIVNAVVNSYIDSHSVRKKDTVSKILEILQDEKVKSDDDLSEKWRQIVEFTRLNGVVSFDNNGGNVVYQKLLKLSEALTDAQLETITSRADWQAVKTIADQPAKVKQFATTMPGIGVSVFVNDTKTQLESELRKAKVELENARDHVTKDHPAFKALAARIKYIEGQIQGEMKKFSEAYIEIMEQRHRTSQEKEQTLLVSFEEQREASQELGVKTTEYAMLQSELKRADRFCEILDDRIKKLNVLDTENAGKLNIQILEVARAAEKPSKPQKARVMGLALVLGLMFGMALAMGREWMDIRLHSAEEISAVLGLPVFGVVPAMVEPQRFVGRGQKAWLSFKPAVFNTYNRVYAAFCSGMTPRRAAMVKTALAVRNGGGNELQRSDVVARGQKVRIEPRSAIAEAYRTIRTAVFFGIPKGEAKTILVTSPDAGDGKSTLVSNLGIAMAQAGQKTLILDADFRRPMQHNIFEFGNDIGVSSVFASDISIDNAIRPGPVEGLDILSCGPEVPNPSEILNSDTFVQTINEQLVPRYDRIIVDSPPVGPVADSQILAAICDVTLLVLRAEKSTRKNSRHACGALQSVGAQLPGIIVNDVPRRWGRYGYYSRYRDRYRGDYGYYGHSEKKQAVSV